MNELIGKKCSIMVHRGANAYAPQNTLPAFIKAFDLGFTSFETDIHLTKDNIPVICHDYKINNVSDGIGNIADYTLEKLSSFDFGSYFSDDFKSLKITTLTDLLELVKEKTSSGVMNIEIKSPKSGDTKIVDILLSTVSDFGLTDRLLISSFDAKLLLRAKIIKPEIRTAYLYPSMTNWMYTTWLPPFKLAKEIGAYSLHPLHTTLTKEIITHAHKLGFKICPWTVNKEFDIEKCLSLGVDGIITDSPESVREAINKYEIKKYS